jgi:competence protein ComEC
MFRPPPSSLRFLHTAAAAGLLLALSTAGVLAQPAAVSIRVVDTGPGLCTITVMPDGHYMVFDAGNFGRCFETVKDLVPNGETIDLMVLSHSDSDHLIDAGKILDSYRVATLIWAPYFRRIDEVTIRMPEAWKNAKKAVKAAREQGRLADEHNLARRRLDPGTELQFGDVKITLLSGFNRPPKAWGLNGGGYKSEHRNAGSVVLRLEYEGHAVLFTGDAVGRKEGADDTNCIATERYLLDTFDADALRSDVLIAPHHGSDDASSLPFIEAVQPRFVIFSAGHDYKHPRAQTAERYLTAGVSLNRMLRTDLGDGEGGEEWDEGAGTLRARDPVGDDDVEIRLTAQGVSVRYRTP